MDTLCVNASCRVVSCQAKARRMLRHQMLNAFNAPHLSDFIQVDFFAAAHRPAALCRRHPIGYVRLVSVASQVTFLVLLVLAQFN